METKTEVVVIDLQVLLENSDFIGAFEQDMDLNSIMGVVEGIQGSQSNHDFFFFGF